jgi:hypothetical protein
MVAGERPGVDFSLGTSGNALGWLVLDCGRQTIGLSGS